MLKSRYAFPLALVLVLVALAGGIRLFVSSGPKLREWRPDNKAYERDKKLVTGAIGRAPRIWEPSRKPDVVLIVLDTTRLDRLGVYGYDKETTPRLDKWAANARIYDNARADGPWTLPSHASLFTGKWPIAHGAHGVPLAVAQQGAPLKRGSATVARAMRQAGYRTVGIAANKAFLDKSMGLDQGFDVWLCGQVSNGSDGTVDPTADRVQRMAQTALAQPRDASLFLFLNFMDPHTPWHVRAGYVREPDKIRKNTLPGGNAWQRASDRLLVNQEANPETIASWSEAYDAEIRFMDEHLGALLEALPSLGIDEDDFVFIVSDHGEYLGEHHLVQHSRDVYETVNRVPLLIRGPGYSPGRDATPLQHHDLAGMILAAAGLPALPDAASTATSGIQVTESYYARKTELVNPKLAASFDRVRRAFVQAPHALILGSDGSSEGYDLETDPGQESPLATAPWLEDLKGAAAAWQASQVEAATAQTDEPVNTEALRALGYIQ